MPSSSRVRTGETFVQEKLLGVSPPACLPRRCHRPNRNPVHATTPRSCWAARRRTAPLSASVARAGRARARASCASRCVEGGVPLEGGGILLDQVPEREQILHQIIEVLALGDGGQGLGDDAILAQVVARCGSMGRRLWSNVPIGCRPRAVGSCGQRGASTCTSVRVAPGPSIQMNAPPMARRVPGMKKQRRVDPRVGSRLLTETGWRTSSGAREVEFIARAAICPLGGRHEPSFLGGVCPRRLQLPLSRLDLKARGRLGISGRTLCTDCFDGHLEPFLACLAAWRRARAGMRPGPGRASAVRETGWAIGVTFRSAASFLLIASKEARVFFGTVWLASAGCTLTPAPGCDPGHSLRPQ